MITDRMQLEDRLAASCTNLAVYVSSGSKHNLGQHISSLLAALEQVRAYINHCFTRNILAGKYLRFFGHHPNHTEAKLEYTTTFEQHQVQKYLTSNHNMLIKAKLSAQFSNSTVRGDFDYVGTPFGL